jgi:hypothetical protein
MTPRFIIDEKSIDLNGLSSVTSIEIISTLLDLIEDATLSGHGVCYDDDLFIIPLVEHRSFWDLCDPDSPVYLPPDVRERATAAFSRMPKWYEVSKCEPVDLNVRIDGGVIETTAAVAWAHRLALDSRLESPACICASTGRRCGAVPVEVSGNSQEIWFVAGGRDVENYFRWLLAQYATESDQIAELASSAFSQLLFINNCFDGIGKMSKPCRELVPTIVYHLGAFSDEGKRIFSESWQRVPAEFGSLGVNISDENGGTKNNIEARRNGALF